jgi:hypothetical protein
MEAGLYARGIRPFVNKKPNTVIDSRWEPKPFLLVPKFPRE